MKSVIQGFSIEFSNSVFSVLVLPVNKSPAAAVQRVFIAYEIIFSIIGSQPDFHLMSARCPHVAINCRHSGLDNCPKLLDFARFDLP